MENGKRPLQFGLNRAIPEYARSYWGARFIFPDDLVSNRQDFFNPTTPEGLELKNWLNSGALACARTTARRLADSGQLLPDSEEDVVLYEDNIGRIVGSPNRSFGYLYVVAYLKQATSVGGAQ